MTTQEKIKRLVDDGYRIEIQHNRRMIYDHHLEAIGYEPRGGYTNVRISREVAPELEILRTVAVCSEKDNYNKKIGASIAVGRAYKLIFGKVRAYR